ncbi:type II toxin-antitoxin system death-on-curing family toxin [Microbulbifer sp. ANSA003]|uniref:type II toxin-antitoxin system death-on-curing family toxin n=1 Tax=Microbulbifer sp. ANSA003 TaxID=3243360 RepID=UPI0040434A49
MFDSNGLVHLDAKDVQATHDAIIESIGGLPGNRENMSIEAPLHRVHFTLAYSNDLSNIFDVAAFYAEAISRGHVFADGNKRTATVCMLDFLELNGETVELNNSLLTDKIVDLAEGRIDFKAMSRWLAQCAKESFTA